MSPDEEPGHEHRLISETQTIAIVMGEVLNLALKIWLVVVAARMHDLAAASPR